MKLPTGVDSLVWACGILNIISVFFIPKDATAPSNKGLTAYLLLGVGFLLVLAGYGMAAFLHMEGISGLPYFAASLLLWSIFTSRFLPSNLLAPLFSLGLFAWSQNTADPSTLSTPLLSSLLGLVAGQFLRPEKHWGNFLLPAAIVSGLYWIITATPESASTTSLALLWISVGLTMALQALQSVPLLARQKPVLNALFTLLVGGLASWGFMQNLLLQPGLLNWDGLFTGAIALGFLLSIRKESATMTDGLIHLTLLGMGALVASRLFGTMGWVVLALGILSNRTIRPTVATAAIFLVGRTLLQAFIYQYNPNVTGINITHPYASAALYAGFVLMLILPAGLNRWTAPTEAAVESGDDTRVMQPAVPFFAYLPWLILGVASILSGALVNYFLHAEAAGSWLVALSVGGVGVSLVSMFQNEQTRPWASFLALMAVNAALLTSELLDSGNGADKQERLVVLGIAFLLALVLGGIVSKVSSGRKPVQIS